MIYRVVFSPEAESQLVELYQYIAAQASPVTAARYTEAIVAHCERLQAFPHRGTPREDIRPGLRVTHYKGRCVVAFDVEGDQVSVLGIFYGGRDYEFVRFSSGED
jgi:plasmid stabilization system protein ParE